MACKIYRKTRLGVRRPDSTVDLNTVRLSLGPIAFRAQGGSSSANAPRADDSAGTDGDVDLEEQKIGEVGGEGRG
jgi:hypothetical protein